MKINKIFVLSIMLISMLSLFVSGTSNERFILQDYKGSLNLDSYNLRTVEPSGIESSLLSACNVGYGSTMGTYPITISIDSVRYNYLAVPTSSAIRLINSNCSEIDVLSLSGVTFYGTMSTLAGTTGVNEKYVLMGYNATSGLYGFYAFSFDNTLKDIVFDSKKDIGSDIDLNKFNGVACGSKLKTVKDLGKCAIAQNKILTIWDIETDTIMNITTTYSMNRLSPDTLPFGSVIDFDNDGNNEFFFSGWDWFAYYITFNYVTYDLATNTTEMDKGLNTNLWDTYIKVYPHNSLNNFDAFDNRNINHVPITPCQIGGVNSEFEVCISAEYVNGHGHDSRMNMVLKQDDTKYYQQWSGTNHLITMGTGVYTSGVNKEFLWFDDVLGNVSMLEVIVVNPDFVTEEFKFNITVGSLSTGFSPVTQSLFTDIEGDTTKELILSNGQIYSLSNGTKSSYSLPYLTNSSNGQLVAGDLNADYVNEIIYSDSSNIYIYSTNPTDDYYIDLNAITTYGVDEDSGINYIEAGYTFNGTTQNEISTNHTVAYDTCLSTNLDVVQEFYLNGYNVESYNYDCTTGGYYSCIIGQCVNQSEFENIDEGIQNGSIIPISGGIISETETPTTPTTDEEEVSNIFTALQNNLGLIFALIFIIAMVGVTATSYSKEPFVLALVGIVSSIIMVTLGLLDVVFLIIILISLAMLMVLAMTVFNKK